MERRTRTNSAEHLEVFDAFPGKEGQRSSFILELGKRAGSFKRIADIGGGANPLFDSSQIQRNAIEYFVLDVSEGELQKAPGCYQKILVDATAPLDEFCARVGRDRFDLVFSHDFLEHVRDPFRVHENIHSVLRPNGLAIHFYPSPRCLPLIVNRYFPEKLTRTLLRIAQPKRDVDGRAGKFPAFYRNCGAPSVALRRWYKQLGFGVVRHTGFIGHDYYARFPILRELEGYLRPILCKAGIPMISRTILILQKNAPKV